MSINQNVKSFHVSWYAFWLIDIIEKKVPGKNWNIYCQNGASSIIGSRARGTDFVRLRPASASVRFLRNLPVRRPNPSLKRTNEVRPPSASVHFGKIFSVRCPNPSAFKKFEPSAVRIRPLESVHIGQASTFVHNCPPSSASVRLWGIHSIVSTK